MKKINFIPAALISGAAALLTTGPVNAQGWLAGFDKQFYVGLGGGNSRLAPDTEGTLFNVTDGADSGGLAFIGVDFGRRLTAELQFADLGAVELQNTETEELVEVEYSEISLSGLYYLWNRFSDEDYLDYDGLDLRAGFSAYGRVGVGQMDNNPVGNINYTRENDVQLLIGLGVEYGWQSGFAARLEHIRYDSDALYTGFSLLYRVGGPQLAAPTTQEPELPVLPAPKPITSLPAPPPPPPELPELTDTSAADSDLDGVLDEQDLCLQTAPGTPVNTDGCELFNGVVEGVNFLSGSDTLTEVARSTLDEVVVTLQSFQDVRLLVEAHTDGLGQEAANLELSRRRALSVVRYLIAQGISIDRLQARAYGETRPIADNETNEGRTLNRRVEFRTMQ